MEPNSIHLKLTQKEFKDLQEYCSLNELDVDKIMKSSYLQGFRIEKYGLLGAQQEPKVQEIIKEVEVEKIVYVDRPLVQEVIKEVVKEVPIEKVTIKEVIKEIPIEKIVYVTDDSKLNELVDKINELENREPEVVEVEKIVYTYDDQKIVELENKVQELESRPPQVVEVVKEVVKEVPVEVVREVVVSGNKTEMLQQTLQKLRIENVEKDKKINELLKIIEEFNKYKGNIGAAFLKGSNLNETI